MSSTVLYLENLLWTKGEAFINTSGLFYPINSLYSNKYAYASPYSQLVYDQSIPNTIPFTGLYLDSTYITPGQSGLAQIDYRNGKSYFSTPISSNSKISGSYSVSEFAVAITDQPEYRLIFETKKFINNKTLTTPTGLLSNEILYPVIFIRENGGWAEQYAFGGEDLTVTNLRLIILGDSQFNSDAVTSLLKDQTNSYVPLLYPEEFPFNAYGGLKNSGFNYQAVVGDRVQRGSGVFIEKVQFISMTQGFRADLNILQAQIFPSIVDITLSKPRMTRQ